MLFLLTSPVLAASVSILPGEDWCAVANSAAPGDEITLLAGEHPGPCALSTSGAPGAPIVVRGEEASIAYDGSASNVIDVLASHLVIEDLSFGPTSPGVDAIKVKNGSFVTVRGCRFEGIGGITISANSADSDGLVIRENTLLDLRATGIYLGCHDGSCRARDYEISDNVIDGVRSDGVGYGMEMKLGSYGIVARNTIHGTQGPGIEVYGSDRDQDWTEVVSNVVLGSRDAAAIEIGGGPALVRANVAVGGAVAALYAYDYGGRGLQRGVHLVGNTAIGDDGPAIAVAGWSGGRDLALVGNAAAHLGGGGSLPELGAGIEVAGNVACDDACWADLGVLDLAPTALLVGAGVASAELGADLCGQPRAATPTAGAVESAATAPARLMVIPVQSLCATDPADSGDSGDDVARSGCGCTQAPAPRWLGWVWLGAVWLGVALRRRAQGRQSSTR